MSSILQNAYDVRVRLREFGALLLTVAGAGSIYSGVLISPTVDLAVKVGVAGLGVAISAVGWTLPQPLRRWRNHVSRQMTEDDVGRMFTLLSTFGPTSPLPMKLAVLRKNARSFTLVEREEGDGKRVVGYFVAYRLTRSAVARLKSGALSGSTIRASDVVPVTWTPFGLYVSFLWGADKVAKGAVVDTAKRQVRSILAKKHPLPIFARVGTPDSLRLLRKYQFATLHSPKLDIHSDAFREVDTSDSLAV